MGSRSLLVCLLVLCVPVWPGLARECNFDKIEQNVSSGSVQLIRIKDSADCLRECCDDESCHLVVVVLRKGGHSCEFYNCSTRDACALPPMDQISVYRNNGPAPTTDAENQANRATDVSWKRDRNQNDSAHCLLPSETGPCRAAFQRYYYSVAEKKCLPFIYGGCGGNKNNFEWKSDCEVSCNETGFVSVDFSLRKVPVSVPGDDEKASAQDEAPRRVMSADEFAEHCEAEPEVGLCKAAFLHWYYDSKTRTCQTFIYGGCQGNKNNYDSRESCIDTCTVTVLSSPKKVLAEHQASEDDRESCMAAADPGPCRAAFRMFYYNPNTETCHSFTYGGCRGNLNRYSTSEECMQRCGTVLPFIDPRKARSRWTAAFFLFAVLAVISVLLLATLVFIAVRRNKLYRRPVTVSDKEELLPDPDERSSVESLSLPESPRLDKA